jgi:hypothetical protein
VIEVLVGIEAGARPVFLASKGAPDPYRFLYRLHYPFTRRAEPPPPVSRAPLPDIGVDAAAVKAAPPATKAPAPATRVAPSALTK